MSSQQLRSTSNSPVTSVDQEEVSVIRTGPEDTRPVVSLTDIVPEPLPSSSSRARAPIGKQEQTAAWGGSASRTTSEAGTIDARLNQLAELVANIAESYTAAIFVADHKQGVLTVGGVHTLSREFVANAQIPFGCGLVGWTAENGVRISVCPFEHDAKTLLYYGTDQALKSFVAVPILSYTASPSNGNGRSRVELSNLEGTKRSSPSKGEPRLLGVIACDSKKSYAFSKVTEKILFDCAAQAAALIELHEEVAERAGIDPRGQERLGAFVDQLRNCDDEKQLLSMAADLPTELVERDALVVLALADGGVGAGTFYTAPGHTSVSHRLFELVCKHKKLICAERVVHALPTDDVKQRSFLSVPLYTLGKEAGSFNLLSRPHGAFSDTQIAALERIAGVVGRELERIRLRDRLVTTAETSGMLSWKHFALQGDMQLKTAKQGRQTVALLRLSFTNLSEVEDLLGVTAATNVMQRVMRLVDQVTRSTAITCFLHGFQILVLLPSAEADRATMRLCNLIERLTPADLGLTVAAGMTVAGPSQVKIGRLLVEGLRIAKAVSPKDGDSIEELTGRTLRFFEKAGISESGARVENNLRQRVEGVAHVGNWS